ncbi:histidine kinase [Nonomuraea typhae]|uniref:histidine kinase n=1 Tax=Nonomuraea typhae TaxID=2603600 RepID=A0ABW7Z051_9ACTN
MRQAETITIDLKNARQRLSSPYVDVAIAVGLTLLAVGNLELRTFPGVIAVILATAPQAVRRRMPWVTIVLTALGGGATALMWTYVGPISVLMVTVSGVLTFFTLLRMLERKLAWIVTGIGTMLAFVIGYALAGDVLAGIILAAFAAGTGVTADAVGSRAEVAEVKQGSVEQVITAQREQAAMAERARIAREMHDVVAHSISMVAVQAEAAPYTLEGLSEEAKAEFAEIATAARGSLAEMRRLLGVLRADITAVPETAPQPGLARLEELIGQHEGEVDLDVVGERTDLPQAVDVSAYRILQECLANAARHAPGSRVSIELAYRPNLLAIRVANDGEPAEIGTGGHGLIGMRERALGLGGWFTAEPADGGGFLVKAGLPLT